jgi:hypothetical protein
VAAVTPCAPLLCGRLRATAHPRAVPVAWPPARRQHRAGQEAGGDAAQTLLIDLPALQGVGDGVLRDAGNAGEVLPIQPPNRHLIAQLLRVQLHIRPLPGCTPPCNPHCPDGAVMQSKLGMVLAPGNVDSLRRAIELCGTLRQDPLAGSGPVVAFNMLTGDQGFHLMAMHFMGLSPWCALRLRCRVQRGDNLRSAKRFPLRSSGMRLQSVLPQIKAVVRHSATSAHTNRFPSGEFLVNLSRPNCVLVEAMAAAGSPRQAPVGRGPTGISCPLGREGVGLWLTPARQAISVGASTASQEEFQKAFEDTYRAEYNNNQSKLTVKGREVWMLRELEPGDIVVANRGVSRVVGLGTVIEPGYSWRPERANYRHTVTVRWDDVTERTLDPSVPTWATTTVATVKPDLYRRIVLDAPQSVGAGTAGVAEPDPLFLQLDADLRRRKQVVLYGPPGTGKTYLARRFSVWWLLRQMNDPACAQVLGDEAALRGQEAALAVDSGSGAAQLTRVTFHPSHSYEDFVEGFKPAPTEGRGGLELTLQDGVFKKVSQAAREDPGRPYLLLVDEFNRANVPKDIRPRH